MKAWIQFEGRIKIGERGQIKVRGRIEQGYPGCWYVTAEIPSEEKVLPYMFAARGGNYGQKPGDVVSATIVSKVRLGCPADPEQTQRKLMNVVVSFGGAVPFTEYRRKFTTLDEALEALRPGLTLSIDEENGRLTPCVLTHVDDATLGSYAMLSLKEQRRIDRMGVSQ